MDISLVLLLLFVLNGKLSTHSKDRKIYIYYKLEISWTNISKWWMMILCFRSWWFSHCWRQRSCPPFAPLHGLAAIPRSPELRGIPGEGGLCAHSSTLPDIWVRIQKQTNIFPIYFNNYDRYIEIMSKLIKSSLDTIFFPPHHNVNVFRNMLTISHTYTITWFPSCCIHFSSFLLQPLLSFHINFVKNPLAGTIIHHTKPFSFTFL